MVRSLRDRITSSYSRFWSSETAVMLITALVVGLGSGFAAVGFRWLLETIHALSLGTLGKWPLRVGVPAALATTVGVVTPAVGGLLAGLLIHYVAPETQGPGVSKVMECLALHGGRIRPIVIAAKPLATSVTIGSGGSAGREGPVVQIGSAIGSALSQAAHLSDERTKCLVACGAAGGIAATFNAPLAGVMFALEVLLAEFGLVRFTSVVVASVVASLVGHAYFGAAPAFPFPPSAVPETWEWPVYALMGVPAAFVGVAFTRTLDRVDELFEALSLQQYLKPALGGLIVGVVGLGFPRVLGVGYESIEAVLFNRLTIASILVLGLLKIVVTSLTIGSGASGGIFGPCLFIGAMLGGVVGQLVHHLSQGTVVSSSYTLVGMSAVFAAASRAPITAILTLFEMTRDYNVMLPLMLTTVISATLARHLLDQSIYTIKLNRQGIDVYAGRRLDLMTAILVSEAMTPIDEITTVNPSMPLTELVSVFDKTHYTGLLVLDADGLLRGVVGLSDLERAQTKQLMTGTVADIQTTNLPTVFPDQSLNAALQRFGALDVGRIPVVDRANTRRVVGVLRRGDIVRAYSHAVLDQQARLTHLDRVSLERRTNVGTLEQDAGATVVQMRLRDDHGAVGRTIQELKLPAHSLIASIRRDGQVLIPRGDTRLQVGDILVALASGEDEKFLQSRLTGTGSADDPSHTTLQ